MKFLGVICVIIGVAGAWHGPVDRQYIRDWVLWLFFVIVGLLGFAMLFR